MAEEGKPDTQLFQLLSTLLEQVALPLSLCSSNFFSLYENHLIHSLDECFLFIDFQDFNF